MRIWEAKTEDVEPLLDMGSKFCELMSVNFDRESARKTVMLLINSCDGVILRSKKGMIGGLCFPEYMTGERMCQEFFWWSEDKSGKELLAAFEEAAKQKKCVKVAMVSLCNNYQAKINSIYEGLGYKEKEKSFYKVI